MKTFQEICDGRKSDVNWSNFEEFNKYTQVLYCKLDWAVEEIMKVLGYLMWNGDYDIDKLSDVKWIIKEVQNFIEELQSLEK